jgi:polysaccharide export outer membrane protein
MKIKFYVLTGGLLAVLLMGCQSLNPSVMLKTGKDFKYSSFPQTVAPEYKIAPNDELSFRIYSNDGFKLIDLITSESGTTITPYGATISLKVEFDGTVKLPLLGRISLAGKTVREAEVFLEEKYSIYYNKPFVLLEVTNRRVIVFPGSAGAAKVVNLQHENTTLLEALASAGGISQSGKAYKVKLIRGNLKNPEVFLIDLSTIDGIKQADLVLQANDIIYVEPQLRIGRDIMAEILPYLSFVTTMIVFIEFISRRTL